MEVHKATHTALLALRDADNGSGGLADTNNDGAAKTFDFLLEGDPQETLHRPAAVVEIVDSTEESFSAHAVVMRVLIKWRFDKSAGLTKEQAVVNRCRTVFRNVTPGAVSPWTFSAIQWGSVRRGPDLEGGAFSQRYVDFYLSANSS